MGARGLPRHVRAFAGLCDPRGAENELKIAPKSFSESVSERRSAWSCGRRPAFPLRGLSFRKLDVDPRQKCLGTEAGREVLLISFHGDAMPFGEVQDYVENLSETLLQAWQCEGQALGAMCQEGEAAYMMELLGI